MSTTRRHFVGTVIGAGSGLALTSLSSFSRAFSDGVPPFKLNLTGEVFQVPHDPAQWPAFHEALDRWRKETKASLNYNDALYSRPEFAWAASNYSCCFLMLCDERFYDWHSGRYTVESFLEEGTRHFGGFDSVVLWHAYPRIGLDQRNQFDFYRDQPGGLSGLRDAVREFRRRGVRTYINYNPWDTGTRREGKPDLDAVVDLVKRLEVDGVFLDTMRDAADLRAKLDVARPGVIMEGEGSVPLEQIHTHHASWAQQFNTLGVLRHKWLERRHMQHQINRWSHDHASELHAAWLNGSGMMVWENVFGSFLPWNRRDRSTLRTMLPIQRRFTSVFSGEGWTPVFATEHNGVYASMWETDGLRIWTLVNRLWSGVSGPLLRVRAMPDHSYFNLVSGKAAETRVEGQTVFLSGEVPARSIGCFLSAPIQTLGKGFAEFLQQQAQSNARAEFDSSTPTIETKLMPPPAAPVSHMPKGMVEIPAANLELSMQMKRRECGFYDSSPPPCTVEDAYHCYVVPSTETFKRRAVLKRFAMDETLVTNAEYARFLKASGYHPAHADNFLKHWGGARPPAKLADHPVVYIDLDDARAYAKWAGKRLPTEEEWQYAAQSSDSRKYPWGERFEAERCNGGQSGGTTGVRAFPTGRSPFGCYDMCGNVWQWTESERSDNRTRFCILRGGSWFTAVGSIWYTDGGPQPVDFALKFLMTWPGLDRCSTIGFRCAADLEV